MDTSVRADVDLASPPSARRTRDPGFARRRILDAAAAAFAEVGFAGARVDQIAATASLNKRMIYHYFGDKAGLYRAVMADRLRVLEASSPAVEDPLRDLAGRVDETLARLLLWNLLSPALEDPAVRAGDGLPGSAALTGALGTLPAGLSGTALAPMLVAFLIVARAGGQPRMDAEQGARDEVLAHMRELLQKLEGISSALPAKPRIRLKPVSRQAGPLDAGTPD